MGHISEPFSKLRNIFPDPRNSDTPYLSVTQSITRFQKFLLSCGDSTSFWKVLCFATPVSFGWGIYNPALLHMVISVIDTSIHNQSTPANLKKKLSRYILLLSCPTGATSPSCYPSSLWFPRTPNREGDTAYGNISFPLFTLFSLPI